MDYYSVVKEEWTTGAECGSVIRCLPSLCKTLSSIPSTAKQIHSQVKGCRHVILCYKMSQTGKFMKPESILLVARAGLPAQGVTT
jgi:hypothetical protein